MSKFLNTTNRTVVWFKKANDNSDLQMKPPFQRNPVWIRPQKSYLIDSILNGYPIPEIYMQEFVDENGNEQHIIIDGQQRIRSCLEFIEGGFSIKADESPSWGNMKFDDLSPEDKKKVFGYTFIVRILNRKCQTTTFVVFFKDSTRESHLMLKSYGKQHIGDHS